MTQPTVTGHRSGRPGSDQSVQVALLGPLVVTRDGQSIDVTGPKRRALLTFLALHLDTPVGRDEIIEAIWPRRQTGREESTLRVHVSHLRDELEPDRSDEPKVLLTRGQAYLLSGHTVQLDTRRFDELVTEARSHLESDADVALELLDEALAIWRGRPLQDVEYEEFAQESIRSLEQVRVDAIEDRAEALIAVGEDIAAVQDLEPLVRGDATRERPTSLLMIALYRLGRQAEALRTANRHRRHLSQQGLDASPRIGLLEERILNHDPTLLPEETITPEKIRPGRSIRGYELRGEAGRGSIGVVYRAYQPSVGREVAMKVIDPDVAATPDFVRRFAEEARVIASLEHPHIVPLHDFWREPHGAFLVMRWMSGGSLADRLGTSWEPETLARTFDQIGSALGYAHSCGVVHRDVKPANVLFDAGGNAYLCDFGLAVTGIETGAAGAGPSRTIEPPYASPELTRGEGPTVASDIFALGVLLAEAASGRVFPDAMKALPDSLWETVSIATAPNPADRFPDIAAFRLSLSEAVGGLPSPAPRTIRRNPYKGLEPFDETDTADFYGRDDVVDSLLGAVASGGLVAVVGASGSGKSSVIRAGLVPALRDGAIAGSEEWFIVTMVPGTDPFDEFHIGLRDAAVGSTEVPAHAGSRELRNAFAIALDSPNSRALLIIDQFEELFSPSISVDTRERFIDNVVDLTRDPSHRVRVVVTMRADFSDRPLAHPGFGELFAKSSYLLAPMRPEQVEEVIRGPAGRVGVQVEPGLISEIIRDVANAPAYLPLLQYILSELFERRTEDRLTVQAYRSLGGVEGVLERRAETIYSTLSDGAKGACRQMFLRMVHLGDHGEQTRRRLPLTELSGLGDRGDVEETLEAFSTARLLTYDRDPVSRAPTVEVAHETVIDRWTRYRVWIDEARADLLAHRRLSSAARTWGESGEDPSYLLTGGPLATALALGESGRVLFNTTEAGFVLESKATADALALAEQERQEHEANLEQRSRRRLTIGITTAVVALLVGVLAVFAFVQRQRADDLAAQQSRENLARELAAASLANLGSADSNLSLLLAIAAAEETLNSGEDILPEAVEALHLAVINPRPDVIVSGANGEAPGEGISYSVDGTALAYVTEDGEVPIIDPEDGAELQRIDDLDPPAFGVDFHPIEENRLLSIHSDGVREWDISSRVSRWIEHPGTTTAAYSRDGELIAIGDKIGTITIHESDGERSTLQGHTGRISSVSFDPTGTRLVSAGSVPVGEVLVWDLGSSRVTQSAPIETAFPVYEASWHPTEDHIVVTLGHGEAFTFDATSGERLHAFSVSNRAYPAMVFDRTGVLVAGAGLHGVTSLFGAGVGGASAVDLPNGGVPVRDVEFNPADPTSDEVVTLGYDGEVKIWRDTLRRSEHPAITTLLLYSHMKATPDGSRYIVGSNSFIFGLSQDCGAQPAFFAVIAAATGEEVARHDAYCTLGFRTKPAISDDGSMVAFAGPTGNVVLMDVDRGTTAEIPGSGMWTSDLDFSSDGAVLAGGGFDGMVALWDVSSRSKIRVMAPGLKALPSGQSLLPARHINEVEFIPGSYKPVTASADGSVRLWDTTNGSNQILEVFDFAAWSVDVSPDGLTLAATDETGNVRLLDPDGGEEILPRLEKVSGTVNVVFSPDGDYLAGGGSGGELYLWNVRTGSIDRRFRGALGRPHPAFVNGGDELRAIGAEGIVRGYALDPLDLLEIARSQVDERMTEEECHQYLRRSCDS